MNEWSIIRDVFADGFKSILKSILWKKMSYLDLFYKTYVLFDIAFDQTYLN